MSSKWKKVLAAAAFAALAALGLNLDEEQQDAILDLFFTEETAE